ncbi:MAG: Sec-independent protein translocase subunit TatA/TatB [Bacteroidia bacterium]
MMHSGTLLFLESIGTGELFVILLFVLLFFGSKKIPELARGLGKGMREMNDAMRGIKDEIRTQATLDEGKQMVEDVKKEVQEAVRMEPYDGAINRESTPEAQPAEKLEEKPQG